MGFFSCPLSYVFLFSFLAILIYFEDLFPAASLYPLLLQGISEGSWDPCMITRQTVSIFAGNSPMLLTQGGAVGRTVWSGPEAHSQEHAGQQCSRAVTLARSCSRAWDEGSSLGTTHMAVAAPPAAALQLTQTPRAKSPSPLIIDWPYTSPVHMYS